MLKTENKKQIVTLLLLSVLLLLTGCSSEGEVVKDAAILTGVEQGEEESVYKFNAKLADNSYIDNNDAHLLGSLFEEASNVSVNVPI